MSRSPATTPRVLYLFTMARLLLICSFQRTRLISLMLMPLFAMFIIFEPLPLACWCLSAILFYHVDVAAARVLLRRYKSGAIRHWCCLPAIRACCRLFAAAAIDWLLRARPAHCLPFLRLICYAISLLRYAVCFCHLRYFIRILLPLCWRLLPLRRALAYWCLSSAAIFHCRCLIIFSRYFSRAMLFPPSFAATRARYIAASAYSWYTWYFDAADIHLRPLLWYCFIAYYAILFWVSFVDVFRFHPRPLRYYAMLTLVVLSLAPWCCPCATLRWYATRVISMRCWYAMPLYAHAIRFMPRDYYPPLLRCFAYVAIRHWLFIFTDVVLVASEARLLRWLCRCFFARYMPCLFWLPTRRHACRHIRYLMFHSRALCHHMPFAWYAILYYYAILMFWRHLHACLLLRSPLLATFDECCHIYAMLPTFSFHAFFERCRLISIIIFDGADFFALWAPTPAFDYEPCRRFPMMPYSPDAYLLFCDVSSLDYAWRCHAIFFFDIMPICSVFVTMFYHTYSFYADSFIFMSAIFRCATLLPLLLCYLLLLCLHALFRATVWYRYAVYVWYVSYFSHFIADYMLIFVAMLISSSFFAATHFACLRSIIDFSLFHISDRFRCHYVDIYAIAYIFRHYYHALSSIYGACRCLFHALRFFSYCSCHTFRAAIFFFLPFAATYRFVLRLLYVIYRYAPLVLPLIIFTFTIRCWYFRCRRCFVDLCAHTLTLYWCHHTYFIFYAPHVIRADVVCATHFDMLPMLPLFDTCDVYAATRRLIFFRPDISPLCSHILFFRATILCRCWLCRCCFRCRSCFDCHCHFSIDLLMPLLMLHVAAIWCSYFAYMMLIFVLFDYSWYAMLDALLFAMSAAIADYALSFMLCTMLMLLLMAMSPARCCLLMRSFHAATRRCLPLLFAACSARLIATLIVHMPSAADAISCLSMPCCSYYRDVFHTCLPLLTFIIYVDIAYARYWCHEPTTRTYAQHFPVITRYFTDIFVMLYCWYLLLWFALFCFMPRCWYSSLLCSAWYALMRHAIDYSPAVVAAVRCLFRRPHYLRYFTMRLRCCSMPADIFVAYCLPDAIFDFAMSLPPAIADMRHRLPDFFVCHIFAATLLLFRLCFTILLILLMLLCSAMRECLRYLMLLLAATFATWCLLICYAAWYAYYLHATTIFHYADAYFAMLLRDVCRRSYCLLCLLFTPYVAMLICQRKIFTIYARYITRIVWSMLLLIFFPMFFRFWYALPPANVIRYATFWCLSMRNACRYICCAPPSLIGDFMPLACLLLYVYMLRRRTRSPFAATRHAILSSYSALRHAILCCAPLIKVTCADAVLLLVLLFEMSRFIWYRPRCYDMRDMTARAVDIFEARCDKMPVLLCLFSLCLLPRRYWFFHMIILRTRYHTVLLLLLFFAIDAFSCRYWWCCYLPLITRLLTLMLFWCFAAMQHAALFFELCAAFCLPFRYGVTTLRLSYRYFILLLTRVFSMPMMPLHVVSRATYAICCSAVTLLDKMSFCRWRPRIITCSPTLRLPARVVLCFDAHILPLRWCYCRYYARAIILVYDAYAALRRCCWLPPVYLPCLMFRFTLPLCAFVIFTPDVLRLLIRDALPAISLRRCVLCPPLRAAFYFTLRHYYIYRHAPKIMLVV